ncbi:MAG: glycosyltransferase, partial [Planctomycetes bacterium]|nr:glycosyltransferase [Planctomycetota bacterium]
KNFAAGYSGLNGKVIFPGYVHDEALSLFYRSALVYVFPSLYEGFGLPPLEAMAQGCIVTCANSSSLPEVLRDAAVYFDPQNPDDIKSKIISAATDEKLRRKLRDRGYTLVREYSWDNCAHETLSVYRQAMAA